VRGDTLDIFPSYAKDYGIRLEFWGDEIESIKKIDPLTGDTLETFDHILISPAKHFVMPQTKIDAALTAIRQEMVEQVAYFEKQNRLIEAQRVKMRTEYDLEMLKEIGFCGGIENYSRHLAGRQAGERPECLLDYFPGDFLTVIDESHVTLPQVRGMYNGDQARKGTLVEHGFRLPSALDNRPMNFQEFMSVTHEITFLSATPGPYEREHGGTPIDGAAPAQEPDRRPDGRDPRTRRTQRAHPGHYAHQANGGGSGRISGEDRSESAVSSFRYRCAGTGRYPTRAAQREV
jgi:excinuclease ABC subunit B